MASITLKSLMILFCAMSVSADDIEMELRSGTIFKMLREMVNQTKGDTLNLPANATSIRENITDTFSCENRTYGYYADVDNECQIFHVCLPSQSVTGRNVTYRWSFICPAETIFNQEVLTCTRPREAIPCEESPSFYDVNMEFGQVEKDSKDQAQEESSQKEPAAPAPAPSDNPTSNTESVERKPQRWNQANRKKQNIIVETLFKDVVATTKEDIKQYDDQIIKAKKDDLKKYNNYNYVQIMNHDFSHVNQGIQDLKDEIKEVEKEIINIKDEIKENDKEKAQDIKDNINEANFIRKEETMKNIDMSKANEMKESTIEIDKAMQVPENSETVELAQSILKRIEAMNAEPIESAVIEEVIPEVQEVSNEDTVVEEFDNSRLASERSLKRKGRKINRGSLKFKFDV